MAIERAPRPVPEGQYDPRMFMRLAHSPLSFRLSMPRVVTDIADMSDQMVCSPQVVQWRSGMQDLLREGPAAVNDIVYSSFARGMGWTVDRRLSGGTAVVPSVQPMHELNDVQVGMWDAFRGSGQISRPVAVDALSIAILSHFTQLPDVAPDSDPVLEGLDASLRLAPYQITHRLIPDLRDGEASRLFGNRTANDVRSLALEANKADK